MVGPNRPFQSFEQYVLNVVPTTYISESEIALRAVSVPLRTVLRTVRSGSGAHACHFFSSVQFSSVQRNFILYFSNKICIVGSVQKRGLNKSASCD